MWAEGRSAESQRSNARRRDTHKRTGGILIETDTRPRHKAKGTETGGKGVSQFKLSEPYSLL
jgi:hypothetical protein